MRQRASIGIALLTLSHLALANVSSALAQAGTTGGTIGKQDKSISGSEEADRPRAAAPAKRPTARKREPTRPESKQKVFVNPTINGIRVDRCLRFASECNEPAATEWCRSKGFAHATEWKWDYVPETVGQSDGHRCNDPACGGFSKISCE